MYITCACLFSALSRRIGALQISIIIIVISINVVANIIVISVIVVTVVVVIVIVNIIIIIIDTAVAYSVNCPGREVSSFPGLKSTYYCYQHNNIPQDVPLMEFMYPG